MHALNNRIDQPFNSVHRTSIQRMNGRTQWERNRDRGGGGQRNKIYMFYLQIIKSNGFGALPGKIINDRNQHKILCDRRPNTTIVRHPSVWLSAAWTSRATHSHTPHRTTMYVPQHTVVRVRVSDYMASRRKQCRPLRRWLRVVLQLNKWIITCA